MVVGEGNLRKKLTEVVIWRRTRGKDAHGRSAGGRTEVKGRKEESVGGLNNTKMPDVPFLYEGDTADNWCLLEGVVED